MRVILAGQKSFGVAALHELLDGPENEVVYVVTRPDDKMDWAADRAGVHVRYGLDAADVRAAEADLIVCAHSHDFVGRKSRDATKLGALVGHPSLLPRHRGKSAVEWTIRMRDPIAGFSWFWADNGVDTGPIARQDWCHVDPAWTHNDLWAEELFPMGVRTLGQAMADLNGGVVYAVPQEDRFATREPAIEPARLYRPELPAIGAGPEGFTFVATRSAT